jgi:ABC-type transport system substrate-binding protein
LHSDDTPEFLALCDEILAETNQTKMASLAKRVQEYYARALPGIALAWNRVVTPVSSSFRGWKIDPLFGIYNIETLLGMEPVKP